MVEQKDVGARFAKLRKAAGLTQAQVAEQLDMSNETLSRLERGVQWSDFDTLLGLAKLYDVEFADLMAAHAEGARGSQRRAVQDVVDLLRPRKLTEVALAHDLLAVLFRDRS